MPQISFSKKVSALTVESGGNLTYTLELTVGTAGLGGVTITDQLPPQLVFTVAGPNVPGSLPAPVYDPAKSVLSWVLPALGPGTYDLTYQTRVKDLLVSGTQVLNQAVLETGPSAGITSVAPSVVVGSYEITIGVYNEAGELVAVLLREQLSQAIQNFDFGTGNGSITSLSGPNGSVTVYFGGVAMTTWDGTNGSGSPVSNGAYFLKVDNVNGAGLDLSTTQQVTVSRSLAHLQVAVYNEAGEIVRSLLGTVEDSQGNSMLSLSLSSSVLNQNAGPNQESIVLSTLLGVPVTLAWDGTSSTGTYLTAGRYFVEAHWTGAQGGEQTLVQALTIVPGRSSNGQVIVSPNLLHPSQGQSQATFQGPAGSNDTLQVKVYDLAGELVQPIQGGTGANSAVWDASLAASGIYIAVVQIVPPNGGVQQQILKLAVVR